MGVQVEADVRPEFRHVLDGLGYRYWEETENPAYRLFAGPDVQ